MFHEGKMEKLLRIVEKVAAREYEKDDWRGILDSVAELFDADGAAIGEIRDGYVYYTKVSRFVERIGEYEAEKFRVPIRRSVFAEALRRGYVILNDYQRSERATEPWKRTGLKSILAAVLGDHEPFGSLAVGRFTSDKPFDDEDGRMLKSLAFLFKFVIKEELEKKKLFERAIKDYLTGLYNRYFFEEEAHKEIERARRYGYPVSLIIFDLDDFKAVNDRFGHQSGDKVLVKFATVLRKSVRKTDTPVRFGGEEFLLLLPHTSHEEAYNVAERVRERFERVVFRFGDDVLKLTVSAGVASCDPPVCDINSLLRCADEALYRAKREGKNRTVVLTRG